MKKVEAKKMQELKLRPLHRGFVLTDFDNNEVGCKDIEQAFEEIKNLIMSEEKCEEKCEEQFTEKPNAEKPIADDHIVGNSATKKHGRKPRESTVEMHRKILEVAKEQINSLGRVNAAQIARDLHVNASNVGLHLKQMENELDELIKKWQEDRDKKILDTNIKNADTKNADTKNADTKNADTKNADTKNIESIG
jgi:hypothetical protein